MKSLFKMLSLAAFLGLGASAAQAGGDPGDEREFYYRQPDFYHNCFEKPWHPGCRPAVRPHNPRIGYYVQPGVHLELQFGNVHRRGYRDYDGPVIRKVRFCSNSMAVSKAHDMGIRNVRAYAYPDHILIKGTKRGHRVSVTLSRERGCPSIDY